MNRQSHDEKMKKNTKEITNKHLVTSIRWLALGSSCPSLSLALPVPPSKVCWAISQLLQLLILRQPTLHAITMHMPHAIALEADLLSRTR